MAQTGVLFSTDGDSITVLNDSGTTAIEAGSMLFFLANDDAFGTTVASSRAAYAAGDVKVKQADWSTASYLTPAGVAATDIAADGYGTMLLEGLFLNRVSADTEAGEAIMQETTTSAQVLAIADLGTTVLVQGAGLSHFKMGRALTGGSAEKKIILWKLTL